MLRHLERCRQAESSMQSSSLSSLSQALGAFSCAAQTSERKELAEAFSVVVLLFAQAFCWRRVLLPLEPARPILLPRFYYFSRCNLETMLEVWSALAVWRALVFGKHSVQVLVQVLVQPPKA